MIVCKKNRNGNKDNILFIDASKDFSPGKNQNMLEQEHIDKIVAAYKDRKDIDKFAHVVSMDEIVENGFNLNIPRYVDTSEDVAEIDLNEIKGNIDSINAKIAKVSDELKESLKLLGLDFPF